MTINSFSNRTRYLCDYPCVDRVKIAGRNDKGGSGISRGGGGGGAGLALCEGGSLNIIVDLFHWS